VYQLCPLPLPVLELSEAVPPNGFVKGAAADLPVQKHTRKTPQFPPSLLVCVSVGGEDESQGCGQGMAERTSQQ
jgi:hypothetical protein